jgi:hypothetical protein
MNGPAHGMGYSGRLTLQRLEPPMHCLFQFASSNFKVLGAFFVTGAKALAIMAAGGRAR